VRCGPRLKDLGRWSSGGTPPKDREDLWDGGLPWISAKDFDDDRLREPTTFITEEAAESHSRIAPPDSILLIVRGMALAHGLPVAQTTNTVAFNQDLWALVVARGFVPRFIYYALRGRREQLNTHIDRAAHGTARLNDSVLAERVPFPGWSAQQDTAYFLDREGERIERLRRELQDLTISLRTAVVARRHELLRTHADTTRIGRVTECLDGWRVPLNSEERALRPGPYPYWGANAIQGYVDEYLFDGHLVLIGEDGAPFFDDARDVAWTLDGKVWVNNHAHVLRAVPDFLPEFLAESLNAVDYSLYVAGATRDKLTQGGLNNIRIPAVAIEEQERICHELGEFRQAAQKAQHDASELEKLLIEYRDALITEAVTGKLDVTRPSDSQLDESARAAMEGERPEVLA